MSVRTTESPDPRLLLLGPVELTRARGSRPSRGTTSAMECCAWLLENPGGTPSQMIRGMVVAESTRRSIVSRLRTWLGRNVDGEPYLPEAYSGYLELHLDITSDWEEFQGLLSGGVNHASSLVLKEALTLVRGEPLEDVSFQWPWAEQQRLDMVSIITDAAVVLFDRSLGRGDTTTARWAIQQGRLAAGDDELLTVREIQLLAAEGDRTGVDQAIRRLNRAARATGHDLRPDSIQRIQHALHISLSQKAT